jgi:hypothetical protein
MKMFISIKLKSELRQSVNYSCRKIYRGGCWVRPSEWATLNPGRGTGWIFRKGNFFSAAAAEDENRDEMKSCFHRTERKKKGKDKKLVLFKLC